MNFENEFFKCQIHTIENCSKIHISGQVINRSIYTNVVFLANNPIDKKSSYSGTGLPFPCADIAFEGSSNIYTVNEYGNINCTFTYPNSYYTVANKNKIISSVFVIVEFIDGRKEMIRLELQDLYPLRTLINRETRNGPEFYSKKYDLLQIDTSEEVMKMYAKIKVENKIA